MTATTRARLVRLLIRHEGMRLRPYRCTAGYWTIGVGWNYQVRGIEALSRALGRPVTHERLQREGITQAEALRLLDADLDRIDGELRARWPAYARLDPVRQMVIVDMALNLGTTGALRFRRLMRSVETALAWAHEPTVAEQCYAAAAYHMADSLWARQVDDGLGGRLGRVDRLCRMMVTGEEAD